MNYFPKYDGNIHPDEWISDIRKYYSLCPNNGLEILDVAKSFVDITIELPTGINDLEKLCDALKKDITFTLFKDLNKRKLQSLKYISERDGGNTLKFLSDFRRLCYNSEINDIEEQKKYFFKALNDYRYFLTEFYKRMKNINSMNELIKEFEEIVMGESNIIRYESTIALKHVATGKYLASTGSYCYTTGSKKQLIFAGDSELNPNALWKIVNSQSPNNNYVCTNTDIMLQHKMSGQSLGIDCYIVQDKLCQCQNFYHKSPSSNHTEVCCKKYYGYDNRTLKWKFNLSKLGNIEFLRSHDIQFTVGNNTFQEVVCHNERLGGIDEWRIELIKQA
ncbi:hypothetical protein RclHR1_19440004 [Rhizophagus clarus]|uniref:MIR domain-containing protein n=1 Tax=Rhizophagus clarus TaxID=94130 RepID=A0A2Z6QNP1_9GLOM|nr:hypothetical protein RclHR1_19440004 [Rhizophagus clarus]GES94985.1 hypothetical protein GLOIN_2v1544017 [Rhizophagus clarus]